MTAPNLLVSLFSGLSLADDRAWMSEGICSQTDPEAFYPEKGEPTAPAKAVCQSCPVRQICLEYALANGERHGVWGGTSERERRVLVRERNLPEVIERRRVAQRAEVARLHGAGRPKTAIAHQLHMGVAKVTNLLAESQVAITTTSSESEAA